MPVINVSNGHHAIATVIAKQHENLDGKTIAAAALCGSVGILDFKF